MCARGVFSTFILTIKPKKSITYNYVTKSFFQQNRLRNILPRQGDQKLPSKSPLPQILT